MAPSGGLHVLDPNAEIEAEFPEGAVEREENANGWCPAKHRTHMGELIGGLTFPKWAAAHCSRSAATPSQGLPGIDVDTMKCGRAHGGGGGAAYQYNALAPSPVRKPAGPSSLRIFLNMSNVPIRVPSG